MATTRLVPSKPALILEGVKRHLIITDIHIGFEAALAQNKIFVGKNTASNELLDEICSLLESEKPDELILLGDIKSGIERISKDEWNDVPEFLKKLQERTDVFIVPGNHDANIHRLVPDGINLVSSAGIVIENVLLTHGHTMPSENFAHVDKIVIGHVHPVFFDEGSILSGQRIWISIKTKKENIFPSKEGEIEIIVIPSFNRYFYATKKKRHKRSISPLIERVKQDATARIVTLDGTIIGDESLLLQIL